MNRELCQSIIEDCRLKGIELHSDGKDIFPRPLSHPVGWHEKKCVDDFRRSGVKASLWLGEELVNLIREHKADLVEFLSAKPQKVMVRCATCKRAHLVNEGTNEFDVYWDVCKCHGMANPPLPFDEWEKRNAMEEGK